MGIKCPWCFSSYVYAEFVDVGVGGVGVQVTPYGCESCHSYQFDYGEKRENVSEEEWKVGWYQGEWLRDAIQRHSNYMLSMRRIMGVVVTALMDEGRRG
jgi:hypothetical protein